eukprot:3283887-Rhodomonas_salina.1
MHRGARGSGFCACVRGSEARRDKKQDTQTARGKKRWADAAVDTAASQAKENKGWEEREKD